MSNPSASRRKYADLTKDQLVALLRQRDETRLGLVWERDPDLIEADRSLNDDFVALDFEEKFSAGEPAFGHLLIEGDNFDALRALRMTHAARIKCIYIDPPYNTGNGDFIYNDRVVSESPLDRSPRNIYGIYPSDLNNWERPFAEWLDNAEDGSVLWWHRNLPNKPWSVTVTLANGSQFFPDFVISIPGRKTPDSVLLVDTKRAINDVANALIKTVSDHKSYGRTAILFYEEEKRWKIVRYNEEKDKNEVADLFDLNAAYSR